MSENLDPVNSFHLIGMAIPEMEVSSLTTFFSTTPILNYASYVIIHDFEPETEKEVIRFFRDNFSDNVLFPRNNQIIENGKIYLSKKKNGVSVDLKKFSVGKSSKLFAERVGILFNSIVTSFEIKAIGIFFSDLIKSNDVLLTDFINNGGYAAVAMEDYVVAKGDSFNIGSNFFSGTIKEVRQKVKNFVLERSNVIAKREIIRGEMLDEDRLLEVLLEKFDALKKSYYRLYRKEIILRKVFKRMKFLKLSSIFEYHDYLIQDPNEINCFDEELSENDTQFFRDPEAFNYLKKNLFPTLINARKEIDNEVRVWCIGCSTGEEAYSVAILFEEIQHELNLKVKYKIFASDSNSSFLKQAIAGAYSKEKIESVPYLMQNKYFECINDQYIIKREIKNQIIFSNHNIIKDPPYINIDLVLCRNLLVLLKKDLQEFLIQRFTYCLKRGAYLFTGVNELLMQYNDKFDTISSKWSLYQNRSRVFVLPEKSFFKPKIAKESVIQANQTIQSSVADKVAEGERFSMAHTRGLLAHFAPTFLLVNKNLDIIYTSGNVHFFLNFPKSKSQFNLGKMASEKELKILKIGISNAIKTEEKVEFYKVPFGANHIVDIGISAINLEISEEKLFIIEILEKKKNLIKEKVSTKFTEKFFYEENIKILESEVKDTREQLENSIAKYENTNEELKISNHELMSSNEEMQTTNEELQSVNEELHTVNTELQSKIVELTNINNDINNLLLSTNIGTIFLDINLRIRKYTPAIETLFNIQKLDIGRNIFNFSDNFNFGNYRHSLDDVLKTRSSFEFEVTNKVNKEKFLMKINPFINHKGVLEGVVMSFIDINEISRMREEINRWFTLSLDLILITDFEGNIQQINPKFEDVLGLKKLSVNKKNIYEFVHREDLQFTTEKFYQLAKKSSIQKFENRLAASDGHYKWISWSCQSTEDGKIYSMGRDITQEKENFINLKRSYQELEQFSYVATHDLRAPIVNLGSLIDIFESYGYIKEESNELFGKIKSSVSKIHETLHDLIGVVALRKSIDQTIEKTWFNSVFNYIIESIEEQVKMANAEIITDFSEVEWIYYIPSHLKKHFTKPINKFHKI